MTAGDIALVNFPFSQGAAITFKKRPVLVLATTGTGVDAAVWTMMVTGNEQRFRHPRTTDIPLTDWQSIGLARESVLRTTRVWTAEMRDFDRVIGPAPAPLLEAAKKSVRDVLA